MMRPIIAPGEAARRLEMIFPRSAFDTTLTSPIAGWAVAAMIYIDAVAGEEETFWTRPSGLIWQQDSVLTGRTTDAERREWRRAASKNRQAVEALLDEWKIAVAPRFRENSRETLRDDILASLDELGAVRQRPGLATTSPAPRWALEASFADLFLPQLADEDLVRAVEEWTDTHLDAGYRLRAHRARSRESLDHVVTVTLPDGQRRTLEPSGSSLILKGVIEEWAPRRLADPVLLSVSEPGQKMDLTDGAMLAQLGVQIDVGALLPDALLADLGTEPVEFWIVEAVSTDGPIDTRRKRELLEWAAEHHIRPSSCRFLTAFASRNASPAKRRLKDLAIGTFAWFADEPESELGWCLINNSEDAPLVLDERARRDDHGPEVP